MSLATFNVNYSNSFKKRTAARSLSGIVVFALGVLLYANSVNATVYVYERADGSKLITDKKQYKKGYSLKKRYKTTPYRSTLRGQTSPYFSQTIKSQFDALIVNTALKYNLEPSFIKAIVHVESAFDQYAISSAGAMGLMQIMPATAANYQLKQDQFNPHRNVEAGVQHLKELMNRYDSDKKLSLAAYNAGEGAVRRYNGVPPYEETENYIVKVMKLYKMYKKEI